MPALLEKQIETAGVGRARRKGWIAIKVGYNGWPDRQFIQRSVSPWIEVKRPGGKLTPLQAKKIEILRSAGVPVAVCYSADEMIAFLDSLSWWLNDRYEGY